MIKKKSLVTGGAGFIGSNLTDSLIDLGHEVTVIDNESSDSHNSFYWNKKSKNYKLDIRDYANTRPLYDNIDYVFHIAAESKIEPAINNPVEAVSINSVGTATVLQCAREAGVKRLIYSSTAAAYGKNQIPNHEKQSDDCMNPYSISKVNGEKLCSMYTNLFGLNTVIFRYFNVYGERQSTKGRYAPVVGLFIKQMKSGKSLTITGDGTQKRDFVHVSDIVNANILAVTKEIDSAAFGQIYNVGSGKNYSINEIARMISKNIEYVPPRVEEVRESLSNIDKLRLTFAWEPKIDLLDWIKTQV
jgi:UDP-glucose 4-epimerase